MKAYYTVEAYNDFTGSDGKYHRVNVVKIYGLLPDSEGNVIQKAKLLISRKHYEIEEIRVVEEVCPEITAPTSYQEVQT